MYNKLNKNILRDLTGIVGEDNILLDIDSMIPYSHDESPFMKIMPEAVVRPSAVSQVKEIIMLANKDNFPVIPRGGGTALTGGSLAVHGGVTISMLPAEQRL